MLPSVSGQEKENIKHPVSPKPLLYTESHVVLCLPADSTDRKDSVTKRSAGVQEISYGVTLTRLPRPSLLGLATYLANFEGQFEANFSKGGGRLWG